MKILNALRFLLIFILDLVKNNVGKTITVSIMITSFIYMGTFPETREEYKIVKETKVDDINIYIYPSISNDKISYGMLQSNGPLKLENGKYISYSTSGLNILFYVLFGLSAFLMIITTILGLSGEDDAEWDFQRSLRYAFSAFIKCEEENGKFYYILFGRLVAIRDHLIENHHGYKAYRDNLMWGLNLIGSFSELRAFPKYKTKKNKRSELLEKMGI